jgi:trimeric autotransporter adhesin
VMHAATRGVINVANITERVYADSTTAQLTLASTLSATPVATINVTQFNAADTVTASTLSAAGTKAIVATITGAGAIGSTQDGANAGASVTIAAGSSGATTEDYLYVYPDGRNGVSTITITVNGAAVATKTVSFYGAVKGYAASTTTGETLSKKQIAIASASSGAVAETATVTIKGTDALGTPQAPGTIYVTTDTATIATAATSGGVVYIYGVGLGTTNVNVCNTSACTSATIKYSFPITVVEKTAASYKVAFDATSYAPGSKVTWTVTATTKTGKPIADGSRAVIGTSTTNMSAPVGTLPTGSLTFKDGVATDYFYAPATTGDFVITTLEGAAHDGYIAGIAASAAYAAAEVANTISIVNPTLDAAADAANEATDAANAATDAALAAADAADAATAAAEDASAAVAALAKSVNTALKALKKQITSLTALVNKLLKK